MAHLNTNASMEGYLTPGHEVLAPGSSLRRYTCPQCSLVVSHVVALKRHIVRHHECPTGGYACQWNGCKKRFVSKNELGVHYRKHTAEKEKPFICADCHKSYSSGSSLNRHQKRRHSLFNDDSVSNMSRSHASTWSSVGRPQMAPCLRRGVPAPMEVETQNVWYASAECAPFSRVHFAKSNCSNSMDLSDTSSSISSGISSASYSTSSSVTLVDPSFREANHSDSGSHVSARNAHLISAFSNTTRPLGARVCDDIEPNLNSPGNRAAVMAWLTGRG